jgi:hypothetical protein
MEDYILKVLTSRQSKLKEKGQISISIKVTTLSKHSPTEREWK